MKDVIQETDHPFLNFYTLVYEVIGDDMKIKPYRYFMASRNSKDELLAKTHDYSRPSGVLMALYYEDPESKEISIMMTRQFRPPMGDYMTSVPAGLLDPEDEDEFEAAEREAYEEAGVEISDIELLCPPGATSSGFSDEMNSVVLARISRILNQNELEEFEDLSSGLVPLSKVREMMKDTEKYKIPLHIRLLLLYLLERFKA